MQFIEIYPKTEFPLSPCWCMLYFWSVPVVQDDRNQTVPSTHISVLSHICTITETQRNNINSNTITTAILSSTVSDANAIFNNVTNMNPSLSTISRYYECQLHLRQRKTCIPPSPSSRDIFWFREGSIWKKRRLQSFSRIKTLLKFHIIQVGDSGQGSAVSSRNEWIIAREVHLSKSHQPIRKWTRKDKAPTKSAAASTATTKKPPATKPPPTTMPPPRTTDSNYINWKQDPVRSALARDVEEKLKGLDTQLAEVDIIIPDKTLRDHVMYIKYKVKKSGCHQLSTWRISH